MKRVFAVLVCCFNSLFAFNQSTSLDSLLLQLKNHPQEDSFRTELVANIARSLIDNNKLLAIKYYNQSIELGDKVNTKLFVGNRYIDIGNCYVDIGNATKGLSSYLEAEKIFKELNQQNRILAVYHRIVIMYIDLTQFDKANVYINKMERMIQTFNSEDEKLRYYQSKSYFFTQTKKFDSSAIYELKVLKIGEARKDSDMILGYYNNTGINLKKQKRYAESEKMLLKAKDIVRDTSDKFTLSIIYNNLACLYDDMGHTKDALDYYLKSLALSIPINNSIATLDNYSHLASFFERQKEYKSQADYLKKYYELKDSLFNKEKQNQMNQLEQNYVDETNTQILQKQKDRNKMLWMLSSFCAIIAFGTLFFYSQSRKKNQQLEIQKQEIEKQKDALQQLNTTKDKLFSIIGHDLRNPLVTLSSYLEHVDNPNLTMLKNDELKLQTKNALLQSVSLLDNLLTWAQTQLHQQEVTMHFLDLDDIVEQEIELVKLQASQKNITIQSTLNKDALRVIANEQLLGIVIRNLLTNAIKFSQPSSRILFIATKINEFVELKIIDEGIGMSAEQRIQIKQNNITSTSGTLHEKGTGLGLSIIRELLFKMNIEWDVTSEASKGTQFSLFLKTV